MKCPHCNYEQGYGWHNVNGIESYTEVNQLGDKFKLIKGSFFAENEGSFGGSHEVSLYGCPKCHIVILVD